jgi:hypothetical protein
MRSVDGLGRRSHECERGTQECVRHGLGARFWDAFGSMVGAFRGGNPALSLYLPLWRGEQRSAEACTDVDAAMKDPPTGAIDRDKSGRATTGRYC